MQVWSEQGLAWGGQESQSRRGWRGLGWWPRGRSTEEVLQGRWARLARKLDRECDTLRRRMERTT